MRPAADRPTPVHYLRPNHKEWSPPSVIFLDTETEDFTDGSSELLHLRLWVCHALDRREGKHRSPASAWGHGTDSLSLARWIDSRCSGRNCVWLYAHNLNFDLTTTRLPLVMATLGWQVKDFSVRSGSPWMRLGKGSKTLTVVDSFSWLPSALGQIGELVNLPKLPLPEGWDDADSWMGRCRRDVEILGRAVLDLMAWWDREALGRWTISGAGCGWNAMRHLPTHGRHVIDPSPEMVAEDRQAVRGGRKDARRVGQLSGGPFVELDLVAAYPSVAKFLPLPTARYWAFQGDDIDDKWFHAKGYGVIATVELDTTRARYPVKTHGVNWYPVGRFRTTLAGPELRWGIESGDVLRVCGGQVHKLGYALQPWADWVISLGAGGDPSAPAVARLAAKSWGRTVIGKFAAHGHSSELLGPAPVAGWQITDGWSHSGGQPGAMVDMAGKRWQVTYDLDTENCYPAVLAWVESEVRVRMGRLLEQLDGAWVSCDTDGAMVDLGRAAALGLCEPLHPSATDKEALRVAERLCDTVGAACAPLTLRAKKVYGTLDVLGPQHLVAGGVRKFSGVRQAAVETAPLEYTSHDWPRLAWQIKNGAEAGYVRPERTLKFDAPLVHRWTLADGTTRPVTMRIDAQGANEISPWAQSQGVATEARLAPKQYHGLAKLWEPPAS